MSITNPTPGGSFGGDGSAVQGSGRNPGGQFTGIGNSFAGGSGLCDTVLWIGPTPPVSDTYLLWINTSDGRWYGYWNDGTSTQWVDLSLPFGEGLPGPQGIPGEVGEQGPVGQGIPIGGAADEILVKLDGTDFNTYWGARPADGNTIVYGSVDPTTEGEDGDTYINTTSNTIFGPKAAGVWPAGTSLVGPTGGTGPAGTQIVYGTIAPTTEGNDGDTYINTTTDEIHYDKSGGVWPAGVSLVGPTGLTGDAGPTGPAGEGVAAGGTAGQVLAKIDGTDYNTEWVDQSGGGGGGAGLAKAHRYYRVRGLGSDNLAYIGIADLQMRNEVGGADVTSTAFAIDGSNFGEPTYQPENAFNGDLTDFWLTQTANAPADSWVGQDFGVDNKQVIREIVISSRTHASNFDQTPNSFEFEYSDDNVTWTSLYSGTPTTWTSGESQTFEITPDYVESVAFTDLTDAPGAYTGHGSKLVKVNSGATGLEFVENTFTDMTDTPGTYGTAGQIAAINGTTDGLEWVTPATPGDAVYIAENALYDNDLDSSTYSSSAYATKGNIYTVTQNRFLTALRARLSASQTVKVVIAETSEVNPGTITSIVMDSPAVVVGGTARVVEFNVDNIELETGKFYAIMFVRTDGSSVSPISVPFEGHTGYTDRYGYLEYEASIRYASNSPTVSDTVYFNAINSVCFQVNTVSSEFFSTVRTTQSEITASSNVTEDDLSGNVVRRVNNASAITITVAPDLANHEPVTYIQTGAGQVTFAAGAGVTIQSADGNLKLRVQYSSGTLIPDVDTANLYYLIGDLTA